jgi:N-acetylmuramoyl-L-alanine amidase
LLPLITLLVTATGALAYDIRSTMVNGRQYVSMSDVAAYYGLEIRRSGKTVILSGSGRRVEFTLQRREGTVDGTKLSLAFAPVERNGDYWFGERDLTLNVDPLLRDWGLPAHNVGRIVIDPGHGGRDRGAIGISKRIDEKTFNSLVSQRVAQLLESRGYEVVLTRTRDEYVELFERSRRCRSWRGTLFLSIHANGAQSASAEGIEVFALTPKETPSTGSTKSYRSAEKGNAYDTLNTRLAWEVQRQMIRATGARDRGVRRARWAVLKDPGCPAILVECGFLTNRSEESRLRDTGYRYNVAVGIANGVLSFHRAVYNGARLRAGQ